VYSAGTHPSFVHPLTVNSLEALGIATRELRSKSVNEFVDKEIDLAITVCDSAKERCPYFPFAKKLVHKGYPDPVSAPGAQHPQALMDELRDQMRLELRELVTAELGLRKI
jgi:arsenate reductase